MTREEKEWLDNYFKEKKIKIDESKPVIVIGYEYWIIGGVEKVLLTIMEGLSKEYTLILVVPQINRKKKYFSIPEYVQIIELENDNEKISMKMLAISQYVNAKLFIGNANLNFDFLGVYKKLRESNIKSIMVNHYFWLFPYMHEAYLSKIIEERNNNMIYPDQIVGLTHISSYLCSKSAGRQIVTIGNPNTYERQNSLPWNTRDNMILTIARYDDPIKRLDEILKIFSKVYEKNQEIKLVIVGKVDYKKVYGIELEEQLKELNLPAGSVLLEGEQEKVARYYQRAKVFLFASEMEGFGLVLNEAACFGTPVISNYYLGIEDIITQGENGYYFNGKTDEGQKYASEKILQLFSDEKEWSRLSVNAAEMSDRYSKEEIMKKWKKLIQEVLSDERKE